MAPPRALPVGVCNVCLREGQEFYAGNTSTCKGCVKGRRMARYAVKGEAERESMRVYARVNVTAATARSARWRAANRERARANARASKARHIEQVRAAERARYAANIERERERSREYRARCPETARRSRLTRRAREAGAFVETVDPQIVFERDEGVCGICNEPVERDDFHVDHVIPLARDGEHSYANVQTTHPSCNLSKGDRL